MRASKRLDILLGDLIDGVDPVIFSEVRVALGAFIEVCKDIETTEGFSAEQQAYVAKLRTEAGKVDTSIKDFGQMLHMGYGKVHH